MDIFSIPQPPYKELNSIEGDLDKLSAIWAIVDEWDNNYNSWKKSKFKEIQVCAKASEHFAASLRFGTARWCESYVLHIVT